MNEKTAIVDSVGTMRGHLANAGAVKSQALPAPVVIATTEEIRAGSVLIKSNASLPDSVQFESKRYRSWSLLTEADGFQVGRTLSDVGWHFLFMVPEVRTGALSSNRNRGLRKALKKVLSAIEAQRLNAMEIAEINTRRLLGLSYVEIVAYPRHVKNSPFLRDLDPNYVPRNVWNFKQVLRRRAQISPTSKGI